MQVGATTMLLNNPVVFIGSTDFVDEFVEAPLVEPTALGEVSKHVAVPVRAQVAPVEIAIWRQVHPSGGIPAFAGSLDLSDGMLAIFDADNSTRFVKRAGTAGVYDVTIFVDDLEKASRIWITLDPKVGQFSIGDLPEYPLPSYDGIPDDPTNVATILGLVLSAYDHPLARLANALKVVFVHSFDESSRKAAINFARIQMVVEWLRWLGPSLSREQRRELGGRIERQLAEGFPEGLDQAAMTTALQIWQLVEEADRS